MRETIAYSKDYKEGTYLEQLKLKPEGFKNKVTALLYDENGSLLKEEYTENIVHTKNLDLAFYWNYYSPVIYDNRGTFYTAGINIPSRYLVLTDYAGAENADNLLLRGKLLAYAYKSSSTVTADSIKGYMNLAETQKISNYKYKYVFDFPQNTANGTFQSLWFGEGTNPFQLGGIFYSVPMPDIGDNYGAFIYEKDGYWVWDSGYIKWFDYKGVEDANKRINMKLYKTSDTGYLFTNYSSTPRGRLIHKYSDGSFLVEFTAFSDRFFKISTGTDIAQVVKTPFNNVFGTTCYNGNIYWLCNYNGTPSIAKYPIASFETITDFTSIDSTIFKPLLDYVKVYLSGATASVINNSTRYSSNISIFEGKIALALNSIYYNSNYYNRIFLIDANTLSYIDNMDSGCNMNLLGSSYGADYTGNPGSNLGYYSILKFINDSAYLTTGHAIGKLLPPFSHAKLPSPITKDNSQSLKIIYEVEVLLPDDFMGVLSERF